MVDLDSNPTKLIEVVEIGKQMLITRGALTTFSIANDVAKYFAIIPAMLVTVFPVIAPLNLMHLQSPVSAFPIPSWLKQTRSSMWTSLLKIYRNVWRRGRSITQNGSGRLWSIFLRRRIWKTFGN